MPEHDRAFDLLVQNCLRSLGLALLVDWDVLIFLYRHGASLANADQIARFLGHPSKAVFEALERLESHKLVKRSRLSQGVRFYQFAFSDGHGAPESCFTQLIGLAGHRTGRLLLVKYLQQARNVHLASKGEPK